MTLRRSTSPRSHLAGPSHTFPHPQVKHIVVVQPSTWAKMMLFLSRPFVSAKAADKVKKVGCCSSLGGVEIARAELAGREVQC